MNPIKYVRTARVSRYQAPSILHNAVNNATSLIPGTGGWYNAIEVGTFYLLDAAQKKFENEIELISLEKIELLDSNP